MIDDDDYDEGPDFNFCARTKANTGKKVCHAIKKDENSPRMKKRKLDVPEMVDGETPETCEEHKKAMVIEMTKTKRNYAMIKELLELTHPYRRQKCLLEPKKLDDILIEHPALQLITEVRGLFAITVYVIY